MPEQISKYPDVTLNVLKGAGAVCGEGAPQKILKQCPEARFCSLRSGEICVYGIQDIPQMTQITPQELAPIVCPGGEQSALNSAALGSDWLWLSAVFIVGLTVGRIWTELKRRFSLGRRNRDP